MNRSSVSAALAAHPEIAALAILVLGVVLAYLARGALSRALAAVDHRTARYATSDTGLVSQDFIGFSRALVFWVIILAAILAALFLLGIDGPSNALGALFAFLPQLIIGFAIVGAGHLVGLLLRSLTARLADSIDADSMGPRLVHWSVLLIAVVMGLQQMHIDITFLTQLVLVLVVVIMGGLALAFALGSRRHVANLIAGAELQRYAVGDQIGVGEHRGTISSIHRTGIEITTDDGVVAIPAARFAEEPIIRLPSGVDDE